MKTKHVLPISEEVFGVENADQDMSVRRILIPL